MLIFLPFFSTPAYDWAPNPDKQWILQVTDRMEPIHKKFTDTLMTKRLQTLQSIGIFQFNLFQFLTLGGVFISFRIF